MKKILGVFIVMVVLVFGSYIKYTYYTPAKENTNLNKKIKSNVEGANIIDFGKITDFDWDKMYVIGPYSDPKEVLKKHHINWTRVDESIESSDSINMIIFTNKGSVVCYVNYKREYGDFELNMVNEFDRLHAVFNIIKKDKEIKLVYRVSANTENTVKDKEAPMENMEEGKLLVAALKDDNINLYSVGYGEEGGSVLSQFVLDIKGKSKVFKWSNIKNPLFYPKLLYKDINDDGVKELIILCTIDNYNVLKQEAHIIDLANFNEIQSKASIDNLIENKPNYKKQVNNSVIMKLMFPDKLFTEQNGIFTEKSEHPTDFSIESVEKGSFILKNSEEYLVVVKETGAPHAIGIENRFAAVINASKAKLISSVIVFGGDNGQIVTIKGKDISYIFFSGTRTYQGYTYSSDNTEIGLWKAGQEWQRLWQKDQDYWKDNAAMADKDAIYIYHRKNFTNYNHETVQYAWELQSTLNWDESSENFVAAAK